MKTGFYFLVFLALFRSSLSHSQATDASPLGVLISHGHPKGGWMFGYSYSGQTFRDNLSGTKKVSDESVFNQDYAMSPQKMHMHMHMLMVMYGLTGRFSFMIMTHYMSMKMDMTAFAQTMNMEGGTMILNSPYMTAASSGLGDTKLYGLYKLINGKGSQVSASVGISFPTGKTDLTGGSEYLNMRLPYMMQAGTGSVDFLPGITYLKTSPKIEWSAQCLAVIRTFSNDAAYHYGNEVTLNAWMAFKPCAAISASVRVEDWMGEKIQGADPLIFMMNEPDADPENYGGHRINGYIGINYYMNKGFLNQSKIGAELGMPVYQNLNGPQLAFQRVITVGFTKSF
jgi:hypothetical protein